MAKFNVVVNQRTLLVVDQETKRCLGGLGSNAWRTFVFPLYTPGGHTVIQEYPFDHPFHNGFFVGQVVKVGNRESLFWHHNDGENRPEAGKVVNSQSPEVGLHPRGALFRLKHVWHGGDGEPVIDEIRTVNMYATDDATICEMTSEKISTYGDTEYPQTKYASIGIRVEPRLLPVMGGVIMADNNRKGNAEVVQEQDSDFVAYENDLSGRGRFGVLMTILNKGIRGPWFIRDYGMALFNPTWRQAIRVPQGQSWSTSLRVVAYDGQLTQERVSTWIKTL